MSNKKITVHTTVHSPVDKVWDYWTSPEHVTKWNFASDDWHCPLAENDARTGGKFAYTMASTDGKHSFVFEGVYDKVENQKRIEYTMADGRKAEIVFEDLGDHTKVTETFDPESTNPLEMQQSGWQAILDNFKKHTEEN